MAIPGPLNGVFVLDLTRVLAGPYCTMVLADLGARVVKVESPAGGDDSRAYGPHIKGKSAYFMSVNREKESIALDLKSDDGRHIFERLLARADVVIENFRAGTMEKLGYGYDSLHARYPRIIYAACSGFGHSGPLSHYPAYDMVVQGRGGVMSLTGQPGGPPTRVGTSIGDLVAGLFTAIGVNGALYRRTQTGEGMKIDVAMLDCQVAFLENALARYFATGEVPGPLGARHATIAPFQCFTTKDGYIIIAAGNDVLFEKLSIALGVPGLAADERFASNAARIKNVAALAEAIEARLMTASTREWIMRIEQAGVPCGPINDVEQVLAEPQVAARNMVVHTIDPVAGDVRVAGNPIKLSAFDDPPTRTHAPELDEHRAAILRELGL